MSSRRLLKAAEAIREVVSMAILTEMRDPRVQNVTVTGVEVAPDMKSAKVAISVMGDEGRQHLCLRGLQNAAGFLQAKIADRIDTRYTPRLTFTLDTGLKKSLEVNRILSELAKEREERGSPQGEADLLSDEHAVGDQAESDAPESESDATDSSENDAGEDQTHRRPSRGGANDTDTDETTS